MALLKRASSLNQEKKKKDEYYEDDYAQYKTLEQPLDLDWIAIKQLNRIMERLSYPLSKNTNGLVKISIRAYEALFRNLLDQRYEEQRKLHKQKMDSINQNDKRYLEAYRELLFQWLEMIHANMAKHGKVNPRATKLEI
jgi:hypothetical protein